MIERLNAWSGAPSSARQEPIANIDLSVSRLCRLLAHSGRRTFIARAAHDPQGWRFAARHSTLPDIDPSKPRSDTGDNDAERNLISLLLNTMKQSRLPVVSRRIATNSCDDVAYRKYRGTGTAPTNSGTSSQRRWKA
jgi:hypothetical protein